VKLERIKKLSLKTYAIALIIAFFVGLVLGGAIVYSQSSNENITIVSGSFTETASYIIFKVGNTIYAKNGTTGEIEFSGTDASQVIQSAINALSSGGIIAFMPATYNSISLSIGKKGIKLVGLAHSTIESSTYGVIFKGSVLTPIINITGASSNYIRGIEIDNIIFSGEDISDCIGIKGSYVKDLKIRNCFFYILEGGAIDLDYAENPTIEECCFSGCGKDGVNTIDIAGTSTMILIRKCSFFNDKYRSISLTGSSSMMLKENHFEAFNGHPTEEFVYANGPLKAIHNFFFGTDLGGIALYSRGDGAVIESNYFTGGVPASYPRLGTLSVSNSHGSIVAKNYFTNCERPFYCDLVENFTLRNNIFEDYTNPPAFGGTGSVYYEGNIGYVTENSGAATISASTSVTFEHGLAGTPTHVEVGWKDTGYGDWKWTANATHITITVTNSGTYSFSWRAYYKP